MDLSVLEELALGTDRAAVLATLMPGTVEHDYWRGVLLQHEGRLDEVDAILAGWREMHDGEDAHCARLRRRQLVAKAEVDVASVAEDLRRETGTNLDDRAEVVVQAQRFPTRLDPALIDRRAVLRDAPRRRPNVDDVTDAAIPDLVRDPSLFAGFDGVRRAVLQRLRRADLPGALDLIVADLADKKGSNGQFGALPVHALLTLAQLDELAVRLPAVRTQQAWVDAILMRLAPLSDVVVDRDARGRLIDEALTFAIILTPAFDTLKATLLYHRLEVDRSLGFYDRARFRAYLLLPRSAPWFSDARMRSFPKERLVQTNVQIAPLGLEPIGNDEPLVRDYLARFLLEDEPDAWSDLLDRDWLVKLTAIARLLAGIDVERAGRTLSPAERDVLRDRVDIDLAPQNAHRFRADDDVALEVDVKNVRSLEVKVFRIDALAYWLARGAEVDTSIDLDGMVPSAPAQTFSFELPPIRRHRVRIALPACKRPGTYVVELIGNGRSSRALLRKGALRFFTRTGAAGTVVTITDEGGRLLPEARLWLGGRELTSRAGAGITIPFGTSWTDENALLAHGEIVQTAKISRRPETPKLRAGFFLERESLVANQTARLLCRPRLEIAQAPASVTLLEDARVDVEVTTLAGTTTTRTQPVVLRDEVDVVVDLNVPEGATSLRASLRGRVRIVSTQETIDVEDGMSAPVNGIHASELTAMVHLARVGERIVLSLLGKTGEPLGGRAVPIVLQHRDVATPLEVTLETDANGEIDLGDVDGTIVRVTALLPPLQRTWWLRRAGGTLPDAVHALEGDEILLPRPDGIRDVSDLSLLEVRRAPRRDANGHVALGERTIRISGLTPGEYRLGSTAITVAPRTDVTTAPPGAAALTWVRADDRLVELPPTSPLIERFHIDGDDLVLRVLHATSATRVHLVATRYLSDPVLIGGGGNSPRPLTAGSERRLAHYISGRDIGDESRYVLERRTAPRRPGMMLEKPSLLLHPWALRTTTTGRQEAAAGAGYPAAAPIMAGAPSPRSMSAPKASKAGRAAPVEEPGFASVDFLAAGAVVSVNLWPDPDGTLRVPLAELGVDAQMVQAFVVDPLLAASLDADVVLPPKPLRARDLRLRLALDPARHFVEQRRVDGAPAGTTLVVPDVRTGTIELVGTVARAHQLLVTLLADPSELRELAFVTEWPALDDTRKRRLYSAHACHELNLFVWRKDPAFFEAVVRPSLADKREKTFVDRFLLGEDLTAFLEPWAFGRLNAIERALFAMALPTESASLARLLGDEVDLIPPDPERDARLVATLLGAAALEAMASSGGTLAPPRAEPTLDEGMRPSSAASFGGPPPGFAADKAERAREILYRGAEKTREWAEVQWWKRRIDETYDGSFGRANRFWRDLVAHRDGPFLSPHLGDCVGSFADAMCALAFLDLPFIAAEPTTLLEETRLTLTPRSHALAAQSSIVEITPGAASSVLIGQSYVRSDDRWEWVGNEQRERRVTGEMVVGVVYRCQVVVTNPTSATSILDVLLQIPKGAIPVDRGFITRTVAVQLAPYGTQSLDYAFYFPSAGAFTHFPAHVTRNGTLLVAAQARELEVVRALSVVDPGSWSHVSQHGTLDEVLTYLARANLGRVELDRIAWRMHDRDAFTRVTALLAARHVYHHHLWAYALAHGDQSRAAEWLRHVEDLHGEVAPAEVGLYQHLEYAPLINARAHRLGAQRGILNDALDVQYRAFLDLIAHRAALRSDDLLAATHYLLAMDRVDEAISILRRAAEAGVTDHVQYTYLSAYVACYGGDLASARALATPGLTHPVDRWRLRFEALVQMLDEVDGKAAASTDEDSRDQRMNIAAAGQAALGIAVAGNTITLTHANLATSEIRFFAMDIELVFSRQPFVQGDVARFSFIEPGLVLEVPLSGSETAVGIPDALRGKNLVIEAVAAGLRRSVAHYAHDLSVHVAHAFGQLRVARASTGAALPAVYVKVYARERGGRVLFYKDGYTDLRGRLDYATLSTDDLDRAERFAILVASDDAGATIVEAPPPPR